MTDLQTLVARAMAPMARRMRLMVGRAVVTAIQDNGLVQTAQVKLLDGEVRDGVEVLLQYGLHSLPPGQREGVYLSVGGDRDHGVLINIADRQFRLVNLAPGEVALADDLGQKVHLTRDGILIDGAGLPIKLTNTPKVRIEADLDVTGEITDLCDTNGRTMAYMRSVYNGHTHHENDALGETGSPTQDM